MAQAAAIYEELQALQKQRRQSELKLRSLDQQRRPVQTFVPSQATHGVLAAVDASRSGHLRHGGTGANAMKLSSEALPREGPPREGRWQHDGGRSTAAQQSHEGPPREGRWKHDGGSEPVSGRWQGSRDRDRDGLEGKSGFGKEERPRVAVRSAVSKPGEDENVKSRSDRKAEGIEDEPHSVGQKRKDMDRDAEHHQEGDEDARRHHKASRGGRDSDDRRERNTRPAWRDGMDTSRIPRTTNRLSSVIAVGKGENADTEAPKPKTQLADNDQVKKRNRKMFGALLGHLQKAKKEEEVLISTPTMQKRAEMDVKAETKAAESSVVLREQVRKERIEERRRQLDTIRDVRQKQLAALHTLTVMRADEQCKALSHFIRTNTQPAIFWLPKKPEVVQDTVKKTADMLGGELLLLKGKLTKEREEDIAKEAERQKDIEARITAAREMAEAREHSFMQDGEDVGHEAGAVDVRDKEVQALQEAVEEEEEEDENVLDEAFGI